MQCSGPIASGSRAARLKQTYWAATCCSRLSLGNILYPHGHDTAAEFAVWSTPCPHWFRGHFRHAKGGAGLDNDCWRPLRRGLPAEGRTRWWLLHEYHVPMEKEATGFVILGKRTDDDKYLMMMTTAFHIPFGFGLYMPPALFTTTRS